MIPFADLFLSIHLVLLLGFIGVTSVLMLVTLTNRLRLRRVALTWRAGPWRGLPVWPVLFLLAILGLLLAAVTAGRPVDESIFLGYFLGGLFWLVSAVYSTSVVVTDYGVVTNVNYAEQAVAWGQIVDYFSFSSPGREGYVFIYVDAGGSRHRLELIVPPEQHKRFQAIMSSRLDARFEYTYQQLYGKEALEG